MAMCTLCTEWCTPMADYDEPVCVRCDARHDDKVPLMLAARRLVPSFGPGDPAAVAELVDAVVPRRTRVAT